jgi:AcrR family transcriptional regulator
MPRHEPPARRRERILRAAARVFGELGFRGATTRRIADAAGVHEVTLFRHFGSKEELIREALSLRSQEGEKPVLPDEPDDPVAELTEFGRRQLEHLYRNRSLIRMCMGEGVERPEIIAGAMSRPVRLRRELLSYLYRLRDRGWIDEDADLEAAATMLMGSLFSDAMGRDYMPLAYPEEMEEAPARYVNLVLNAVGWSRTGRRNRMKRQ